MSRRWVVALLAWSLSACDVLMVEPASLSPDVEVRFALSPAPDPAPSFGDLSGGLAAVRSAWFRLTHDGISRDTVVPAVRDGDSVHVRVALRPDEALGWLEVRTELRMEDRRPLFRGHALLHAYDLSPVATVELTPVVWSVAASSFPIVTALGDTIVLSGRAELANGVDIVGAPVEWSSGNPAIAAVIGGNRVVSRSNGSTFILASSLGTTELLPIVVRQNPVVLVGVAPADTTIARGEQFLLRPFGEDANGYPLLPGAGVTWQAQGVVTVSPTGIVGATAAGTGAVEAVLGDVVHRVDITVTP